MIRDEIDTRPERGVNAQGKGYCGNGQPIPATGFDSDDENLNTARRAVRTSARVMALHGAERWLEGAYVLINVAAELGLADDEIRAEWKQGYGRAEHLLSVLRAGGPDQGKETD